MSSDDEDPDDDAVWGHLNARCPHGHMHMVLVSARDAARFAESDVQLSACPHDVDRAADERTR